MKRIAGVVVLLFVLVLVGCAPSSAPTPETETTSTGPDPTVVDADHYKVEFENDRVRVLRITYGPGEKSVMHYHPDNVGVYLTDLRFKMTLPDGSSMENEGNAAGMTGWAEGAQHLPENLADERAELILVELKEPVAGAGEISSPAPDATEADPDHYKVEFENDRVRIVRVTFGPNEKTAMLYHPARVAVFLKDQNVRFTRGDGSTDLGDAKFGEVVWAEAGDLQVEEMSGESVELILVELMK